MNFHLHIWPVQILCALPLFFAAPSFDERLWAAPIRTSVTYPADSGVFNVNNPEFGARGDGKTEDTAAIQRL